MLLLIAFVFVCNSCEVKKEDDECLKKEPLINGTFIVSTDISYEDGVPYTGPVKFLIYKIYCDGAIKGIYEREGNSDESGYYTPAYIYTYKYENLKDRVEFKFEVEEDVGYHVWFKYFYLDIKAEDANAVNEAFPITLPWKSTD